MAKKKEETKEIKKDSLKEVSKKENKKTSSKEKKKEKVNIITRILKINFFLIPIFTPFICSNH